MTMLIEVAAIRPPANGRKVATVMTVTGRALDIWPDKAALLRVGGRYRVELSEREFKGRTYRKIVKAEPAGANSHAGSNGSAIAVGAPKRANAASTPPSDAELQFVRQLLVAGVRTGAVAFSAPELRSAAAMLRALWRDVS